VPAVCAPFCLEQRDMNDTRVDGLAGRAFLAFFQGKGLSLDPIPCPFPALLGLFMETFGYMAVYLLGRPRSMRYGAIPASGERC